MVKSPPLMDPTNEIVRNIPHRLGTTDQPDTANYPPSVIADNLPEHHLFGSAQEQQQKVDKVHPYARALQRECSQQRRRNASVEEARKAVAVCRISEQRKRAEACMIIANHRLRLDAPLSIPKKPRCLGLPGSRHADYGWHGLRGFS